MPNKITTPPRSTVAGVAFGGSAYLIWGLSPVYWKALRVVPSLEIIAHRVVWSFVLLVFLILFGGTARDFLGALKNRRTLLILMVTSAILCTNWLVYIWAVNSDRLLQASLGYYINPLVNVFLGMVFLKERLRRAQLLAVGLAAAGVMYLTYSYGEFPWVSMVLAFTFGLYGLIRKVIPAGALPGLAIETLVLGVPAVIYLCSLTRSGADAFLHRGFVVDLLLAGTGIFTALPLLFFAIGARRLNLSTMGFLQYTAPTCMFLLGVLVYKEPFVQAQIITFILIWTALIIYSLDSMRAYRSLRRRRPETK